MIGNDKTRKKIKSLVVGHTVESDNHPIIVNIERKEKRGKAGTER